HDFLVGREGETATSSLLRKSLSRQREIKESFYGAYYEIRMDVFAAVEAACATFQDVPPRADVLEAVQRLLDRMLFLYYCEHVPLGEKLAERKRHGIYYTTDILSDYLSSSALASMLGEIEPLPATASHEEVLDAYSRRLDRLSDLKIVDFACGSGAFLVSAY